MTGESTDCSVTDFRSGIIPTLVFKPHGLERHGTFRKSPDKIYHVGNWTGVLRPRHQPPMLAPSGKCITICLLLGHPLLMGNGTRIVRFCHQADFVVNEYHGIGPPETDALFFVRIFRAL